LIIIPTLIIFPTIHQYHNLVVQTPFIPPPYVFIRPSLCIYVIQFSFSQLHQQKKYSCVFKPLCEWFPAALARAPILDRATASISFARAASNRRSERWWEKRLHLRGCIVRIRALVEHHMTLHSRCLYWNPHESRATLRDHRWLARWSGRLGLDRRRRLVDISAQKEVVGESTEYEHSEEETLAIVSYGLLLVIIRK
jgi:hypothetical protein